MKKMITLIIAVAMILTMSVPAFAADADAAASTELTATQVKAITPSSVKAASYSYSKIKVSWAKIEGVDGYKVYRATSKNGTYSLVYTTSSADKLYYINTGRTTGKTYYYKVRGYKKIGKTTYYTKYSTKVSAYARPNKGKISSIIIPYYDKGKAELVTETYGTTKVTRYVWSVSSSNSYKGFRVSWSKISGATGYQLYMREKGKTTWKSLGYYTGTSAKAPLYNEDGDTIYDTYYKEYEFKVRAYRTVNGKKVYGLCSAATSYEFTWDEDDLVALAKKMVEDAGYIYCDKVLDSELGYDIVEQATMWNGCGWYGPKHVSYYYSLEYIKAFFLYGGLSGVYEHGADAYCLYISDVATEKGAWRDKLNGKKSATLPMTCEFFCLSNAAYYLD